MISAKHRIVLSAAVVFLCLLAGPTWTPTYAEEQWQRVYTGDGSVIELNTATIRFEPGAVLRAEFRTVFSKPETVGADRAIKCKTRLEKIDFRMTDRRYRFFEISLLDSAGKLIQAKTADGSEDWRVLKPGGITERLFNAACVLTPLGAWKVVSYRFAEGDPKEKKTTAQLDRLIGVLVHLHIDRAEVGAQVCTAPSYQDRDPTPEELRQLGVDWKSIGIKPQEARTVHVRCEESGWQPSQSLLIKENNKEEMLMLWNGVFLVLKRT
ncbi:MAG TPA: hypothetical protein VFI57_03720 [Pyrinomonadaceae bacterium]|nr:hypothetical protein [Pyrinomonadaceae bacterium]